MKIERKITRIQLDNDPTTEDALFGIVSPEPDYKLSLVLNKKLKISLRNNSPVIIDPSRDNQVFSRFSWHDSSSDESYNLVANRSGSNFLLKNLKNIDYILRVHEPERNKSIERVKSALKGTESITALFLIDPKTIKTKYLQYLIP
jgi:hypothetical protein